MSQSQSRCRRRRSAGCLVTPSTGRRPDRALTAVAEATARLSRYGYACSRRGRRSLPISLAMVRHSRPWLGSGRVQGPGPGLADTERKPGGTSPERSRSAVSCAASAWTYQRGIASLLSPGWSIKLREVDAGCSQMVNEPACRSDLDHLPSTFRSLTTSMGAQDPGHALREPNLYPKSLAGPLRTLNARADLGKRDVAGKVW